MKRDVGQNRSVQIIHVFSICQTPRLYEIIILPKPKQETYILPYGDVISSYLTSVFFLVWILEALDIFLNRLRFGFE